MSNCCASGSSYRNNNNNGYYCQNRKTQCDSDSSYESTETEGTEESYSYDDDDDDEEGDDYCDYFSCGESKPRKELGKITTQLSKLSIGKNQRKTNTKSVAQRRPLKYPKYSVIKTNPDIVFSLRMKRPYWSVWHTLYNKDEDFAFVPVHIASPEVENLVDNFDDWDSTIEEIYRIENPYLLACYNLKKHELLARGNNVQEKWLFHGTRRCNVNNIARNNFDWRLNGTFIGHRFGKGVSFSPSAHYSTFSSNNTNRKVMLYVKVLTGYVCNGHKKMILPDEGCDTSQKPNGDVLVKYEDNTFYPAYKIIYNCTRG